MMNGDFTVISNLEFQAAKRPDALLARQDDRRITYSAGLAYSRSIARALIASGHGHGDRFAVYGHPHIEVLMLFLAGSTIGSIFVGIDPKQTRSEIERVFQIARPKTLFVVGDFDETHAEKLALKSQQFGIEIVSFGTTPIPNARSFQEFLNSEEVTDEILMEFKSNTKTSDPVAMVFTSGSTGRPKGALLTSGPMILAYRIQAKHWYESEVPPHGVADLPIHHLGFIADNCMAVISSGGAVSIIDRWTPERVLQVISDHQITFWWTQTTMMLLATQSEAWDSADFSTVRTIGFAGAPVSEGMLVKLQETGAQLVTSYGMTEVHGNVTYTKAGADHEILMHTVGKPDPAYRVHIVDDAGNDLPAGEIGEIVIDSPTLITGYWYEFGDVRSVYGDDGWYHTNDLAKRREDGNFELVGRKDNMFKSGGFNVYSREVELVLEGHAAVAAAVVLPVADKRWGHVGHAYIRTVGGSISEAEILEFARARLANYKIPKRVVLREQFPMLASGKVDRVALSRHSGQLEQPQPE